MGLTNGSAEISTKVLKGGLAMYDKPIGTAYTGTLVQTNYSIGITTDPEKSGIVVEQDSIIVCIKY